MSGGDFLDFLEFLRISRKSCNPCLRGQALVPQGSGTGASGVRNVFLKSEEPTFRFSEMILNQFINSYLRHAHQLIILFYYLYTFHSHFIANFNC